MGSRSAPGTAANRPGCSAAAVRSGAMRTSSHATTSASSRNPAAIGSSAGVPSGSASRPASHGPKIAPAVPPTEISANSRLPWSLEKRSAISAQNTMVTNRLNTLNHT